MATAKLLTAQKKLAVSATIWLYWLYCRVRTHALLVSNSRLSFGLFFQDLDASLQNLTAQFEKATAEKIGCQEEVACTKQTIELANRLVKGLEVR